MSRRFPVALLLLLTVLPGLVSAQGNSREGEMDHYTLYLGDSPAVGIGAIVLTNTGGAPLGDVGGWLMRRVVETR